MPSTDLQACEPHLREAFMRGRQNYEQAWSPAVLRVTATHRSVEEQQRLWRIGREFRETRWVVTGRVVTQVDGMSTLSKHNYFPARAIDFCVTWGGKVTWDSADYEPVGPYMEAEGLIWGGRWTTLKDYPHVELP